MGVIKDLLKEELENSMRMKSNYKDAIQKQPGGSIVKKKIRGHIYLYLAYQQGGKVRFIYKGKELSQDEKRKLEESRRLRAKYKDLIEKLSKRIKYLRKALRGKED